MKKLRRELEKEFPYAVIEMANGGHLRLRLPNGRSVFTSSTPSDRRTLMNLRSEVRRTLSK